MKNRASERRIKRAIRQGNMFAMLRKNDKEAGSNKESCNKGIYVKIVRG